MVNAKHARPLAAFWLLALAAALITALGLLGDRQATEPRHGSPIRVPSSAAPELVLGGVLHAQPNRTFTSPLSAAPWIPAAKPAPSSGVVQASSTSTSATTPASTPKARTKSGGGHHHTATVQEQASDNATTSTTTTRGHGKGRNKSDEVARTTTTTTATVTASPTDSKKGRAGGRADNPGKGH